MIIAEVENTVKTGGLSNQKGFTIKASEKAFHILSSSIYTNKIRAIIRELSCNALDAHRAAGCVEKPFIVHLPNAMKPVFYVQDFGIGLSKEEVENLYTTYFESTKTTSNEFTGALGLGSKSPFSYVDCFTVVSVYEGQKHSFMAYKDNRKLPAISHVSTAETDQENGLYVELPVAQSDYYRFYKEAEEVFAHFDTKPRVLGYEFYDDQQVEVVEHVGRDVKLVKSNYTGYPICAVQGNVAYPIKNDDLGIEEVRLLLGDNQVVIDFPIGELNVAPSREDLDWDDNTFEKVQTKIKEVSNHLYSDLLDKVQSCDSEIKAKRALRDWASGKGINSYQREKISVEFNGEPLSCNGYKITRASLKDVSEDLRLCYFENSVDKATRKWVTLDTFSSTTLGIDNEFIIAVDVKTGFNKRVHKLLTDRGIRNCYGFPYESEEECQAISDMFGGIEIIKASAIPLPKGVKPNQSKRTKVLKYRRGCWLDCDVDLTNEDETHLYVDLYRDEIAGVYGRTISYAGQAKIVADFAGKELYGVRTRINQGRVKKLDNWINVGDYFKSFEPKKSYINYFKSLKAIPYLSHRAENIIDIFNTCQIQDCEVELLTQCKKLKDRLEHSRDNVSGRFGRVRKMYGLYLEVNRMIQYDTRIDEEGLIEEIKKNYPILTLVDLRWGLDSDKIKVLKQYIIKEYKND